MYLSNGLRTLVFIFLSKDVSGVITNAPLNAFVEVGHQTIFNCTSDVTFQNWILAAKREDLGNVSAQNIAINCMVQPGFTTHYEVDRPGGNINICNLIVKDTTMQQAGIYTCTDTVFGPSAILTITDKLLNATYNTTAGVVVEKDNVIIECVLNYNGTMSPAPTLRPYFYWTDFNGQNVSSSYNSTTDDTAVSQLKVTAGRQNITSYTCHVYFQLMPPITTGYASNTPTVSSSATSPIITVFSVPPSTTTPSVSESTATLATAGSTTACTSGDNCPVAVAAAIAVGVILFISLALNIMQLVIMAKNIRTKNDPYKRTGTMMPPETLDLSNEPPAPATYQELTRSNEIHLQPTYDKLASKPPTPATYQELRHPNEIHLQPPTYEKLTTKLPSDVDDLS